MSRKLVLLDFQLSYYDPCSTIYASEDSVIVLPEKNWRTVAGQVAYEMKTSGTHNGFDTPNEALVISAIHSADTEGGERVGYSMAYCLIKDAVPAIMEYLKEQDFPKGALLGLASYTDYDTDLKLEGIFDLHDISTMLNALKMIKEQDEGE